MNDHVHRRQFTAPDLLPIVLSHPAAQPVTDDGSADPPARGQTEPGLTGVVGVHVEDRDLTVQTTPPTVDPAVLAARPYPLRPRCGVRAALRADRSVQLQTVRRLRPLRRRRERIARPCLVRIRERKPCFFLRRRLFGWYVLFTFFPS